MMWGACPLRLPHRSVDPDGSTKFAPEALAALRTSSHMALVKALNSRCQTPGWARGVTAAPPTGYDSSS